MEQKRGLHIWVMEDMDLGLATVWAPMVLMACPMALATMAAMLVMAHTGYGRDLWMLVGQDQRDPQNRFMALVMTVTISMRTELWKLWWNFAIF